jgi:hypothetical protein
MIDCIKNQATIREMYAIAAEAMARRRNESWGLNSRHLASVLSSSVSLLQIFAEMLTKLRAVVDKSAGLVISKGWSRLIETIQTELSDDYLAEIKAHLRELKFYDGMLISAELGDINQGIYFTLRRQSGIKRRWLKWRFAPSFSLSPRDDGGFSDLASRKVRATIQVTNTLYQSAEHVLSFFEMLKHELAFYVGALNLYDALIEQKLPVCFPEVKEIHSQSFCCNGLYDVSLALVRKKGIVGNEINANGKNLVIITGANQGGKTTFLRSFGQAQLMMQCGMFVSGGHFSANVCSLIFTHFKKEEDAFMKSGKLDEELARMSDVINRIKKGSVVLFNESFSSTNEREGSEIGRQIVDALIEKQIKVVFVTHMFEFANGYYQKNINKIQLLRAQRRENGERTFKIVPGAPLLTSFGSDLYEKIFHENTPSISSSAKRS